MQYLNEERMAEFKSQLGHEPSKDEIIEFLDALVMDTMQAHWQSMVCIEAIKNVIVSYAKESEFYQNEDAPTLPLR